jgi:hypothetical protein
MPILKCQTSQHNLTCNKFINKYFQLKCNTTERNTSDHVHKSSESHRKTDFKTFPKSRIILNFSKNYRSNLTHDEKDCLKSKNAKTLTNLN